jgi:hypothetical protein
LIPTIMYKTVNIAPLTDNWPLFIAGGRHDSSPEECRVPSIETVS